MRISSLLSWERGLKFTVIEGEKARNYVAPLVGAWIEIRLPYGWHPVETVAPLVGAWIEILGLLVLVYADSVAPLVGAWIEIVTLKFPPASFAGRSSRGSVD